MDFVEMREMIDSMFAYGTKDSICVYFAKDIANELTKILYEGEELITSCGSEIFNNDFSELIDNGIIAPNEGNAVYCYEIKR